MLGALAQGVNGMGSGHWTPPSAAAHSGRRAAPCHAPAARNWRSGQWQTLTRRQTDKQIYRVQTIRHAARYRRRRPPAAWLGPGIATAMQNSEHGLDLEAAGQRPKCSLCVSVSLCVECGRYTERLRTDSGSQNNRRGRGSLVAVCGQTRTENYRIRTPLVTVTGEQWTAETASSLGCLGTVEHKSTQP